MTSDGWVRGVRRLRRSAVYFALAGFLACGKEEPATESARSVATFVPETPKSALLVDLPATHRPNPLELPPRALDLAPSARVFTMSEPSMRRAKLGSALQLVATTVKAQEGQDWLVDGRDQPDYVVHGAYVIPLLSRARPPVGRAVIAELAGTLRHGVVKAYAKDKVVVRFTDTPDRGVRHLPSESLALQLDGFRPGNYAAVRGVGPLEHVLLISPLSEGPDADWLALGFGGLSRVVKSTELVAVPVSYEPKVGSPVWAEHLGKFREGVVSSVDTPGVFAVKFARTGAAVQLGWGFLMPGAK